MSSPRISKSLIVNFLLGFSSGLPFYATLGTLQAWMVDEGIDLKSIAIFTFVRTPISLKFLWAPFMDRYVPPFLGRRRGWMLISQLALALTLSVFGLFNPSSAPWTIAFLALLVNFFSASQDIVLDAYRREAFPDAQLGLATSIFVTGYRIGMITSGAVALYLAESISWVQVYLFLAAAVGVGVITTLVADEPAVEAPPPRTLRESVVGPMIDFFSRNQAILFLLFILLYKLGDNMCNALSTPFILKLGFSKAEYGIIAKSYGLCANLVGGVIGGVILLRIGIDRALWIFGVLQIISVLNFALLVDAGHDSTALAAVVIFENLSLGMGTSAYAAFVARLCNKRFSATQYALLSSLMALPTIVLSAYTGVVVEYLGWSLYFVVCAALALPGMFLLTLVAPWRQSRSDEEGQRVAG